MHLLNRIIVLSVAGLSLTLLAPSAVDGQGRGRGNGNGNGNGRPAATSAPEAGVSFSISLADREIIRDFYVSHPQPGVEALPPGIRRNLERGKPLPPGIAKKVPPAELRSRLRVPDRYEIVEVGLDVLLVEVATGLVHDVLMDVIR